MLGTKLKSSRNITVILVILSLVLPALFMMEQYWNWYVSSETVEEDVSHSEIVSKDFLRTFLDAGYVLYNLENREGQDAEKTKLILRENSGEMASYERLYPFLDYRVKDEDGKDIAKSTADSEQTVRENNLSSFALGMVITYDEYGNIDVQIEEGEYKAEQSIAFREIISEYDSDWAVDIFNEETGEWETIRLEKPKNRTYIYAMTKENLETYIGNCGYTFNYVAETMVELFVLLILVVAALAWLLPVLPVWYQKDMKILRAPLEVTVLVFCVMTAILGENLWWIAARAAGRADFVDFIIWTFVFAVTFWAATCLRQVYTLGVGTYLKERTLCVRYWQYIRKAWIYIVGKIREWIGQCYHFIDRIDLSEKSNQTIFKIVAVNFIVLALICSMWIGGLFLLGIYSAVLFWLLRKYFNELQEKYAVLFKATGEIAKGNLDVEIVEDLGIFSPFKQEIQKIQTGFKKAVDEEVKSQRMKTELITNVSHDLKTPLTAIITYVNLLKDEKDETKREDYIEVLERKSLRLKVLIEDLFEVSKASSKNITLNIVDVDVVNLFKQVKLELEDKITEADLDFRCSYPDEKVTALLDSQKTYRVFENLLVNIIKYAMPHTRVYIEILKEGEEAVVRMKNVSAAELAFNAEELTERFVRGDASRNTEGSGLGLAIVKSFVELQKGRFKIETEADLFKVEVRFKIQLTNAVFSHMI
ncbi:alkaline phosphatase synthesis sensor protein PhoR [Lachnospiraceae bacterium]|nr:alkaline phosphatase synthesis sensor protein PhoR [Lachnospiraceae bacterium]